MKVLLATLNAKYIHASLALRYLRNYCRDVCPNMTIKDYTINHQLLDILGDIYAEKPDVIGLACYIWNIDMTLELAGLIHKVLPQSFILIGGPEVSYDPSEILARHLAIDAVIMGEGETVLRELLNRLKESGNQAELSSIAGLAYRHSGGIEVNGGPQMIERLDDIPFAYDATDIEELENKIIYYESSRGCPFACQYCLSSATQGVRFLSLERVRSDLSFFIRHDVKQVKFVDRTFNARKEHYYPILTFLAGQTCRTNFHFEIAADLLDEDTLAFLESVPPGRFQFEVGIQSTYQPALKEIQRNNQWDKIVNRVASIQKSGNIHLHLDLIAGLPHEDYWQFGRSFNDVFCLKPDMLQLGFLKLLKGSGIRKNAEKHGYVYMDKAPYEVLGNQCLCYNDIRRLKIIEELLNQTYNAGRMTFSLSFIQRYYCGDIFRFYHEFSVYWEEHNLHRVAHSVKAMFTHLFDFFSLRFPEAVKLFCEIIKFDVLFCDKNLRLDFLDWNQENCQQAKTNFWRTELLVRKYIPGFTFTTWRDIHNAFHIETFPKEVAEYVGPGFEPQEQVVILFSYSKSKVSLQQIDVRDFWQEGSF